MIRRKLSTLMRMDRPHRALIVEALVCLGIARLSLSLLPFRHVAKRLGAIVPRSDAVDCAGPASHSSVETEIAQDIGWAVRRMAAHAPFKALCLQQALAAKMMLRRRSIQSALHFGVSRDNLPGASLEAHAWLDVADAQVTGYPVPSRFIEIACFI